MASTTIYYHASAAESSGNSGDLSTSNFNAVAIDITSTAQAGTNPTIQFFYERKEPDGIYYPLWQSTAWTAAANTASTSIGIGLSTNQILGPTGRLRWVVGGTSSPTYTFSATILGQ